MHKRHARKIAVCIGQVVIVGHIVVIILKLIETRRIVMIVPSRVVLISVQRHQHRTAQICLVIADQTGRTTAVHCTLDCGRKTSGTEL